MAQRHKLLIKGESRIEKRMANDAVETVSRYLNAYEYNDTTMARFFINHFTTISLIAPGKGSSCHEAQFNKLLQLYNKAVVINTQETMKKYSYYRVSNEHAEGYIKTSISDCIVASLNYEGKAEIRSFETSFKRFNGDVVVEISRDDFRTGFRKVVEHISKAAGL